MKSTYKYRIYPNKSQESKLENTFSMCRHLYNWSLSERITSHQVWKHGKAIEKTINPDKKKVIFSSPMGQFFYTEEKGTMAVDILTTIEIIFGIQLTSVFGQIPRNVNYYSQAENLPLLKKERPWYKGVHSQVLQNVLKRLDDAFDGFVRHVTI